MPVELNSGSLQALLDALASRGEDQGVAYENLRLRLIRFFHWNQCESPEDLADIALDRLAEKLAASAEPIVSPGSYAVGIARMLLHENRAQQIREQKLLSFLSWFLAQGRSDDEMLREQEDALSLCLENMSAENRRLLETYYVGDGGERIQQRQSIANALGIARNALRNRVLRLRRQLEDCASRRLRDRSSVLLTKKVRRQ
jgi:DNA-directed RNA polymerase specialized sigma24 family protein